MRKFFTALVVIPLGLIFIVFAVANRHLGDGVVRSLQFRPIRRSPSRCRCSSSSSRWRSWAWWRAARRPGSGSAAGAARRASTRPMPGRRGRNWPICGPPRRPQRADTPAASGAVSAAAFTGPPGETSRARRCRTRPVSPVQTASGRPANRAFETMSLLVKICGLSTRETLDAALEAGADMVGFVFFPPSPRHLEPRGARASSAGRPRAAPSRSR